MFITVRSPLSFVSRLDEQSAMDLLDLAHTENFLEVRSRAKDVMDAGIEYDRMSAKNVFRFDATAVTGEGSYEVVLRLETLKNLVGALESRPGKVKTDTVKQMLVRGLTDGEVDCLCTCPANLYWGFRYFNTQRGTVFGRGVDIYPDIRSPEAQANSGLCKHLYAVIKELDDGKHLDQMASDLIDRIDVDVEEGLSTTRYVIDSIRERYHHGRGLRSY